MVAGTERQNDRIAEWQNVEKRELFVRVSTHTVCHSRFALDTHSRAQAQARAYRQADAAPKNYGENVNEKKNSSISQSRNHITRSIMEMVRCRFMIIGPTETNLL